RRQPIPRRSEASALPARFRLPSRSVLSRSRRDRTALAVALTFSRGARWVKPGVHPAEGERVRMIRDEVPRPPGEPLEPGEDPLEIPDEPEVPDEPGEEPLPLEDPGAPEKEPLTVP